LEGELEALARNPPTATQLPDIKDVVARLGATLKAMEIRKSSTERQIEMLIQEKKEIKEREEMVQTRLKEAGEQYEKLKKETNIGGAGPEGVVDRGLESFGNTPIKVSTD
jgi:predicted  nucleic acid-binding Zn-ribbon protein